MKAKQLLPLFFLLAAETCAAGAPGFEPTGRLEDRRLDEASGLQWLSFGTMLVHNDEKNRVFAVDVAGRHLGSFKLEGAKNRDWEDLARVSGPNGPLLVMADVGDNQARRDSVQLYFFAEPVPEKLDKDARVVHRLDVRYPDGPRDAESVAYDPSSRHLLIMSKRDVPPRLYRIPIEEALNADETVARFAGTVPGFRPPTRRDLFLNPSRGRWVSQPTGMDISPDGRVAAVITYRSLYLFYRAEGQDWAEAFRTQPLEYVGPPGTREEAVTFSRDGKSVFVTTEGRPAPVHRLVLP